MQMYGQVVLHDHLTKTLHFKAFVREVQSVETPEEGKKH